MTVREKAITYFRTSCLKRRKPILPDLPERTLRLICPRRALCLWQALLEARSGSSRFPRRRWTLHPLPDSVGVAEAGKFALRIEKNDQNRALAHISLHDQASARLIDKARLGEADLPARVPDQVVGVMERQFAAA